MQNVSKAGVGFSDHHFSPTLLTTAAFRLEESIACGFGGVLGESLVNRGGEKGRKGRVQVSMVNRCRSAARSRRQPHEVKLGEMLWLVDSNQ